MLWGKGKKEKSQELLGNQDKNEVLYEALDKLYQKKQEWDPLAQQQGLFLEEVGLDQDEIKALIVMHQLAEILENDEAKSNKNLDALDHSLRNFKIEKIKILKGALKALKDAQKKMPDGDGVKKS